MPEWLEGPFETDKDWTVGFLAARLVASFVLGCVVAGIYRVTSGRRDEQSSSITATLVLLALVIGMVTLVIGNNVARAFSVVGALAIVRFRTVVEDTRDTAFVILAVAMGMAAGAGHLKVAGVGLPIAAVAAFLFRPRHTGGVKRARRMILTVRTVVGHATDSLVRGAVAKHGKIERVLAVSTARQGASVETSYVVDADFEKAPGLLADVNAVEGVQAVELREE